MSLIAQEEDLLVLGAQSFHLFVQGADEMLFLACAIDSIEGKTISRRNEMFKLGIICGQGIFGIKLQNFICYPKCCTSLLN
jgi:hypothetical protein